MTGKAKSYGITALVCGIIAIVGGFIPYVSFVAFILSIISIVFGALGRKAAGTNPKGMATAGLVLGIIALAIDVLSIACIACAACTFFSAAASAA